MESVRKQRQKAKLALAQLDHELKHLERHHSRVGHPLADFIHSKAWIFLLLMHSFSDVGYF